MMTNKEINILLVDDKSENLLALENVLQGECVNIFKASSGLEALELLLVHGFALALLDVQMPEMNGFELAELMRSKESTKKIPIIFVTAGAVDPTYTFQGYEAGAVDFLYKPLDMRVVQSKVRVFKELEEHRLIVQKQYDRLTEVMKWKDDFLSIASHELKTPITSIRLNLQIMERNFLGKSAIQMSMEKLHNKFGSIDKQFSRLTRLIDDLLDTTRIKAGKLTVETETVNFSAHVHDVVERFSSDLTAVGCEAVLDIQDEVMVDCDAFRTEQVLVNLISNVIKYAPGGKVVITLSQLPDGVRFRISDQGPGISLDKLDSIFEQFERGETHRGITGLGLGLYIVKQIMQAHNGSISVESKEGEGSTFTLQFPN